MKSEIKASIVRLSAKLEKYPFHDQKRYAQFLAQAYYFVKHSTPMLALSAGLSVNNRDYHIRCIEHLSEEKGHDKMLLNDLKAMGYSIGDFSEMNSTKALYQTQYYYIQHVSPMSFLGYVMLLEGLAVVVGKTLNLMIQKHAGKSFIKVHSDDDIEHLDKALSMMDSFSEKQQREVLENCLLAEHLYTNMLREMTDLKATTEAVLSN